MDKFDVAIVGGGILGTTLAFWISSLYEGKVAVLEMEDEVARHTSGRNTGVIHRPFYLHPEKRRIFARCAQVSYGLWKDYSRAKNLPWKEVGTLEVATDESQVKYLEKYMDWAVQNGMGRDEVEFLKAEQVGTLEPHVNCLGAVFAKTDTSVDYSLMTQSVKRDALGMGAQFLFGFKVRNIEFEKESLRIVSTGGAQIVSRFLVNCAGGNAMDLAHLFSVGQEYTDLHFRGEYWEIGPVQSGLVGRNIYTVPKHPDIPFLDPHWIARADGRKEIGPNAVLVSGSGTYEGFFSGAGELFGKIFERPIKNKLSLFVNPDFLKLASEEWVSSISKSAMVRRVRRFIPELRAEHLAKRGTAGIRSSVIDSGGNFIKEAIEIPGPLSYHILNYNSPGATGAPAYTAHLAQKLDSLENLSHLKKRSRPAQDLWDFSKIMEQVY